jgi:hypothetical protein
VQAQRLFKGLEKLLGRRRISPQALHALNKRFLLGNVSRTFGDMLIGVGKPAL